MSGSFNVAAVRMQSDERHGTASRSTPSPRPWRRAAWPLLLAGLVLLGLGERVWMIASDGGVLDADEAVVGLMAQRFPNEVATFYWGQAYGASHEAVLMAVVFALLGASTVSLRLTYLLLGAATALLAWRLGRRLLDERVAALGAALLWVWPPYFVWFSMRGGGNYWPALVLALGTVLILVRLKENQVWRTGDALALGVLAGLSWWGNPQTVLLIAPTVVWARRALIDNLRLLPVMALGAALGSMPWLAFNLQNDWASIKAPSAPSEHNTYADHLEGFFTVTLPMALGLRVPFTREWLTPPLGQALYLASMVSTAVLIARPGRRQLLVLIALSFPFLYALSPAAWYLDQPRYVLFLCPVATLLLASFLRSRAAVAIGVAVVVSISGYGLWQLNERWLGRNYAPDVAVPADLSALYRLAASEGVDRAFADYWLSHRITFETGGELVAAALYTVRDTRADALVRGEAAPAYVFVEGAGALHRLLDYCRRHGIPVTTARADGFVVVQPKRRVLPEDVPGSWQ